MAFLFSTPAKGPRIKREPACTWETSPLEWERGPDKREGSSHKCERSPYKREDVTYEFESGQPGKNRYSLPMG